MEVFAERSKLEMAAQALRPPFSIALALCLLSAWPARSSSQPGGTRPSEHGLVSETNPEEVSPAMIAFFGQPKVELPEAENFSDTARSSTAKDTPPAAGPGGGRKRASLLVAGVVLAAVGTGLLATVVVAYMLLHARRRCETASSSSTSLVGLTHWRGGPDVLGAP